MNMAPTTKDTAYGGMLKKFQISGGVIPQIEIPDEKDHRFSVLSYEQVKRLNDLMSENIPIHGKGNEARWPRITEEKRKHIWP